MSRCRIGLLTYLSTWLIIAPCGYAVNNPGYRFAYRALYNASPSHDFLQQPSALCRPVMTQMPDIRVMQGLVALSTHPQPEFRVQSTQRPSVPRKYSVIVQQERRGRRECTPRDALVGQRPRLPLQICTDRNDVAPVIQRRLVTRDVQR